MSTRRRTILAAVVLALLICAAAVCAFRGPVIGTVSGAENEFIEIDGVTYIDADLTERDVGGFSAADRGRYLGVVRNDSATMRVYQVKGDDSGDLLYVRWEWEGKFYIRNN